MRTRLALLATAILLLIPAPALASLAGEQRSGEALMAQVRSGAMTCPDLSPENFDHIGEYVMYRALGSTSAHQAMNDRMTLMLGERGESRMHQLLGERFAGCSASGGVGAYGAMMSGGYYGMRGLDTMMGSADWNWMVGGRWQTLSRQGWQHLEQRLLGEGQAVNGNGGWSTLAIVAVTVGGLLLLGGLVLLILRQPFKHPPSAASST